MSQIDTVGIAEVLIKRYSELFPELLLMDTPEDESPEFVASLIEEHIDDELLEVFMESELGYGIILGIISYAEMLNRYA